MVTILRVIIATILRVSMVTGDGQTCLLGVIETVLVAPRC